ncbi:MAG: hypothetical protein M5U09_12555 [Gammaproteobacteria bacterium]|nr:hypothetical protein [Gammaproteobacteria bacterium]
MTMAAVQLKRDGFHVIDDDGVLLAVYHARPLAQTHADKLNAGLPVAHPITTSHVAARMEEIIRARRVEEG